MRLTQQLRARHAAILVGIGTLLADNPRLTARLPDGLLASAQPRPVILDSHLRSPLSAAVFQHPRRPWVASLESADWHKRQAMEQAGADIIPLPASPQGGLKLAALLEELAKRQVFSLFVEGGAAVITAFLQARLANGLVLTMAPRLLGGQPALIERVDARLVAAGWQALGEDWIVWGDLS